MEDGVVVGRDGGDGGDGGDGDSALVRRAGSQVTFVASSDPGVFAELMESITPEG